MNNNFPLKPLVTAVLLTVGTISFAQERANNLVLEEVIVTATNASRACRMWQWQ